MKQDSILISIEKNKNISTDDGNYSIINFEPENINKVYKEFKSNLENYNEKYIQWRKNINKKNHKIFDNQSDNNIHKISLLLNEVKNLNDYTTKLKCKNEILIKNLKNFMTLGIKNLSDKIIKIMNENERFNKIISKNDNYFEGDSLFLDTKLENKTSQANEDYMNIHEDILKINNILDQMTYIVFEQGTIVDRIDYNLELTEKRVEKGEKHLVGAVKNYDSKCASYVIKAQLFVVIVLAILILIKILI